MKVTIERPCAMPIEIETLRHGKYVAKLTVAGEKDLITLEELHELFKAIFLVLGEVDEKIDRKERKRA